ncbi:diguanylate cyclase [Methylocaldum sp.]|uniref:diguanylate cyclase n=1 Tax=Methylocaldum sp. TaxID=1969727 RepID=UPI002D261DCA|nr:diguanylate cyclase [Methylocaldum sp.]HYE38066.1 diguanylate cyclase [Methylocaldum sp.]
MLITQGNHFEELKTTGKLPSPFGVALEIMRLTQKKDATAQELAKLVQMDPALTGRVIQFANSAHVGARRPVAAVIDAIRLLGMNTIRQFALSLSVIQGNLRGACRSFNYRGFWSGSLARALSAQAIATRDRVVAPEEAFTCALLSEIGQLALASVYPDEYAQCLAAFKPGNDDELVKSEQERFSIDHRQLALGLLKEWGFPAVMLEALTLRYTEGRPPACESTRAERFAAQLRLSTLLGRYCDVDMGARNTLLPQIISMAQTLGLDEPDLEELWEQVTQQWQTSSQFLSIPVGDMPPLKSSETAEDQIGANPKPARLKIVLLHTDFQHVADLEKLLNSDGHEVLTASNADKGVELAVTEKPQLIIAASDKCPTDSIQFCKALRASELGRQIYLIVLTSAAEKEFLVQAFDAGADDFIVTPVHDRVLIARVRGGQRIIQLQEEMARERQEISRYAHELAIAKRKMEVMAMTDSLTKIPNRRYAFARLNEEWSVWRRTGRPLTIMLLDLDHFKQINDTFGHQVGDQVLVHTAKIARSMLRSTDVVCRLGGEEFIVIAPNTDMAVAKTLGERLRNDVEQHQFQMIKLTKPLTISIGIAISTDHTVNENDLLHRADQALYRAKHAGRNMVKFFSPQRAV